MPKRIRDLTALTPATGDHVVIDRPTGSTGRANISADVTPNTVALRNAQGSVQDGATDSGLVVVRIGGIYRWGTQNMWLRLASWTGFSGNWRGLFADLTIFRMTNDGVGARLRASLRTDGTGAFGNQAISLAIDQNPIIQNAVLVQTAANVVELWALFPWGNIYVSGVIGSNAGTPTPTPYGDVSTLVQSTPPTAVSGGIYLEWNTAAVARTFLGPGYIVEASRNANSGYVRYDNGIQICWATISVGSGTWAYPAAFASAPRVLATAEASGVPRLVTITSVSATAAGILRTDLSGNTQSGTVHLWAIGLWK
jgi:hypothetical protein